MTRLDHRSAATRAAGLALCALTASATALSGCSTILPSEQDRARDAVKRFAEGMASGRVEAESLTRDSRDRAARETPLILVGLGERRPGVAVVSVEETAGDGATRLDAQVRYTWQIRDGLPPWSYVATVPVVRTDDGWRVRWTPSAVVLGLDARQRVRAMRLAAPRGEVLGAGGQPLVVDRPVLRVGIDRAKVPAAEAASSARRLAAAVGIDPEPYAGRVTAAGPQAFVEALVLRVGQDPEGGDGTDLSTIPGVTTIKETRPLAPTAGFASTIIGRVGPATAEVVQRSQRLQGSQGSQVAVSAGDLVGLDGLQAKRDGELRGRAGYKIERVHENGVTEPLHTVKPEPGRPLRTTLDATAQLAAERALADVEPAAAVVAIQPSTGEVRAVATGPGSKGAPTATLGLYAPGSTFKVATALALLRAGVTPETTTPCTQRATVDGRSFKNYDDYPADRLGDISLRTAFASSCNTSLISLRDKATQQSLADAAVTLGLGTDPALGVPASLGSVPREAVGTEHAASLIGQGKVQTTPLGMATVVASVAAGRVVRPRLVLDAPDPAGDAPRHPLTETEASALRDLMRRTTTEGSGRLLADVPGAPVLSKTGTAEYGSEAPPRTHAWMVAVQGDLAVAVFVEDGAGGAHTAGPVLERFLLDVGAAR